MDTLFGRTQLAGQTPFEPLRNPGFGGVPSPITSEEVQNAIEEVYQNAPGKIARFTISLLNNSTLTNGQRFTKSELLPNTPVILPYKCQLKALAFASSATNADWSFAVWKYTAASGYVTGTLLFTWAGTNTKVATRNDRSDDFAVADEIRIIFSDTGDNPSDASMDLYFQIVE
jgi:hypothetical protein